jgi:glutamine cyclotransferase
MKNIFFVFALFLIAFISCKPQSEKNNAVGDTLNHGSIIDTVENILVSLSPPSNGKNYVLGDKITITVNRKNNKDIDSVALLLNNKTKVVLDKEMKFIWDTKNEKTGTNLIEVEYKTRKTLRKVAKKLILFSDIKPQKYGFKIKNTYKHDVLAYTQGLFWYNGFLYEATGLKGESTVRKVKLENGDVVQSFAIPSDVFGEGITMSDNKIVQITWQDGKGYVYDIVSFKQVDEFGYSGEGWGLTSDGQKLFMSNGTPQIHILENQSYSIIDELEVYDEKGPVKYLNELEYINGEIYANIYRYETIARIDPNTGKVLAYIDLSHILPMTDYTHNTDVLNGIAYDSEKKRLFVTGKLWPKLFEIELTEK